MDYPKKRFALAAITSTLVALPALAQDDVIKIAFAVPLTGDFAPYNEVDGAECMAAMINADGGVGGRQIELLVQDVGSDSQAAISAVER
ncbi:MAG: ABC transporter substrate-binding protein, partial [Paracoccaceae bacterium]